MKFKRVLALLLATVMLLGVATSCGKGKDDGKIAITDDMSYDEKSAAIYANALGDFDKLYKEAKAEMNVSKRFALMAIAEAKLLESGVMLPTYSQGGLNAISRVAPKTVDYAMWGGDSDRFHQALVATEFIKSEDRAEMNTKWAELKGTGTYEKWAKDFLASKGYTLKDTYSIGYTDDPQTWDALASYRAVDSEAIVNTYDSLLEYDIEGILQPALAESYTVSEDGTVYTFKLRKGVQWVDSQGRDLAELKADDFVAGFQHMLDAKAGNEYLVQGVIKNAEEYLGGSVEFSEVGVKAVDDYTVEYTLVKETPYFTTMLGYGIFAPLCRSYYTSLGGKFGADFSTDDAGYKYGLDSNSIAYCGPYIVTNATAKNTIVFKANEKYWNKDNINIKTLNWYFNDGSIATKAYDDAVAGTLDGCNLNSATVALAKKDGNYDKYGYVTDTDATAFTFFFNLNRGTWSNFNNENKGVSSQTDDMKKATFQAMNNVHFRRALAFSVDRAAYNAAKSGEEVKLNSLTNSYTPGNFVYLEEDVVVKINGKDTTFKANTAYGEIVQAQLDADGVAIKAYDKSANKGSGYDGWYSVENATKELQEAVKELKKEGLEISAENPIHLDYPYPSNIESFTNASNAVKQSVEKALGGAIIIDLVPLESADDLYDCAYYPEKGSEENYDISDISGWGPDYGDPSSYLDTLLGDYGGSMTKSLGIF